MTLWSRRINASPLRAVAGLCLVMATALYGCKGSCEDGGHTHEDGDSWQCSDGCNACSCNDGTMSSTNKWCFRDGGS